MHGDLRDPAVVDRLLKGVDVLIHMAGTSVERPLPEIIENNLRGLYEVYEGARRNGVRRVVFASSNHAFGMHSVKDKLRLDAPFRPDGLYGLSKVWGEAMARMYWDKHGIEGISLRIGSALEKPTAVPPSQHLARSRRPRAADHVLHRGAADRLHGGVGRVRQHAQLLGPDGLPSGSVTARSRMPRIMPPRSCASRTRSTRSRSDSRAGASPRSTTRRPRSGRSPWVDPATPGATAAARAGTPHR